MRQFLKVVFFLFVCSQLAWASYTDVDTLSIRANGLLSTNWLESLKEAVPSETITPESNLQTVTNLLCKESQRGNIAAQGLWGFFVLVQSKSPEDESAGLQLLRNSASNGFVPAMVNLGLMLEGGVYVRQDYTEAFYWFGKAAKRNNSEAISQLGGCYHQGLGTARDLAKAVECYRRSAELTNYVAMKSYGYLLMNGIGVEKDIKAAKYWFTRAAKEGGNPRAMYNLGVVLAANPSDTNALSEAFQWIKKGAESGDCLACSQLASFYYHGLGVVQTNVEAYRFWRARAAMLGSTEAQYAMGAACRIGDGVPKNIENCLAWYQKAAAKNHPAALYDLAVYYLQDKTNRLSRLLAETYMLQAAQRGHREAQFQCAMSSFRGDLGNPDCKTAKQWLDQAAENGWPRAEFCLFELYYNGISAGPSCSPYPKDVPKAIKWLRRAAEHNYLQAQAFLAVMLIQGKEVERNTKEAEKLLRNAAEHGYAVSQNDLGFAILTGQTAKKDLVEAAIWCTLAQSETTDTNAVRRAKVNLSNILSKLSIDQQLEVDERVKRFRAVPVANLDPLIKNWETNSAYRPDDRLFSR